MSALSAHPRTVARAATGTGATLALATVALAATGTAGHAADYTVQEGDTLTSIARRTGTDVRTLAAGNVLADPSRIRAGQVLRLPDAVPADLLVPGHLANPAAPDVPSDDRPWTVLASLQGTLTVLADDGFSDAETIAWLFAVEDSLGTSPIAALRAGRKTEVRRVAQAQL